MEIIEVDLKDPDKLVVSQAAEVLRSGGLIVYPTDTAYGLGGNALNEKAIRQVYALKGRDKQKPIHVVVRDLKMAGGLVFMNEVGRKLFVKFLPGPLTIVFKKKKIVPNLLVGGRQTLGIRIPNCTVTQRISELIDFPYTATSANLSGGPTPYSIKKVLAQFLPEKLKFVDLILDAGTLSKVPPSTIIDLSGRLPKLIREGPISKGQLEEALGGKLLAQ